MLYDFAEGVKAVGDDVEIVKRHQMIYEIFKKEITNEIHAMQIQAYTNEEWKKKNISK